MTTNEKALLLHEKWNGKLETISKAEVKSREDLALAYTPGVAEPCKVIAAEPEAAYKYTIKSNTIAVVSDGSAVLGLGNIGPLAAMPVMEGKAVLFKEFGGVNAFPICLDTQDTEEIIKTVVNIAPAFGGINLEDISAPRCFEIEERLKELLPIPVFHDDQHGTAIVVLAGIINALKVTGKKKENCRVVVNGAGSAGIAITKLLVTYGFLHITMCDRAGILKKGMDGLNWMQEDVYKRQICNSPGYSALRMTETESSWALPAVRRSWPPHRQSSELSEPRSTPFRRETQGGSSVSTIWKTPSPPWRQVCTAWRFRPQYRIWQKQRKQRSRSLKTSLPSAQVLPMSQTFENWRQTPEDRE